MRAHLAAGRTAALLGSSGVGKSTIINRLVGVDVQRTREVRESDSRGRHTTTHRELVMLPGGGLIIDTPGMRELQLWDAADAVRETFDDVEALAAGCHFTDCRHRDEPRCAVKAAVAEGTLPAERLDSYVKLQDELATLARQQEERRVEDADAKAVRWRRRRAERGGISRSACGYRLRPERIARLVSRRGRQRREICLDQLDRAARTSRPATTSSATTTAARPQRAIGLARRRLMPFVCGRPLAGSLSPRLPRLPRSSPASAGSRAFARPASATGRRAG